MSQSPEPNIVIDVHGTEVDLTPALWTNSADTAALLFDGSDVVQVIHFKCRCKRDMYWTHFDAADGRPSGDKRRALCWCGASYDYWTDIPTGSIVRHGWYAPKTSHEEYRSTLPKGAPEFESVRDGKHKLQIRIRRPRSPLCKQWSMFEDVKSNSVEDLERHANAMVAWLNHYDAYYGLQGWEVEVKIDGKARAA